jgi:hypothetical protein
MHVQLDARPVHATVLNYGSTLMADRRISEERV